MTQDRSTVEQLFAGDGEIARLIRSHDWSKTQLGAVETWSDSLKTAVQILLRELDQIKPPEVRQLDSGLAGVALRGIADGTAQDITDRQQSKSQLRDTQRRFELSLTGANLGTWTYNVSTDEFWADDRTKLMHGHAPHEVYTFAGAGVNIHPEDRDRAQAAFFEAIQNHSKLQLEYRVIWPDGSIHGIASYGEFMLTGDRNEGSFYGVARDITEINRAEAALRESEELYRILVFATSKMVWRADAEGNITTEVPGWEQLTGQTFDEYKNFGWLAVVHPDDVEPTSQIWQTAIATHTSVIAEYRLRTVAGDYRRVALRGEPLLDADGNLRGWVGTITDVEDMRRAAEAELAALNQLRQSEEKYRSLFTSIDEGFCTIEVLFDADGKPFDYRFLEVNPAFERQTGLENAIGRTMRQFVPQHEEFWFEIYGRIALTGVAQRFEHCATALGRYYDVYAFRIGDAAARQVAILFSDRKQAEAVLRASEEQLRLFVTASSDIVYKMNADWSQMRYLKGKDFLTSTENASGTWLEQYILTEDQPEVMVAIEAAIRTKSTFV